MSIYCAKASLPSRYYGCMLHADLENNSTKIRPNAVGVAFSPDPSRP